MDLLVNDLSFEGQFSDLSEFKRAIEKLVEIRDVANSLGWPISCHRRVAESKVSNLHLLPQAVNHVFDINQRRALMQWFTRNGPFWEDFRIHSEGDWYEVGDSIVTDSAVGEAAGSVRIGIDKRLLSLSPSSWNISPVSVAFIDSESLREEVQVVNYWELSELRSVLLAAQDPIKTWSDLETQAVSQCDRLTFSREAFSPLIGYPFSSSAANRLLVLMNVLNRFAKCFNDDGSRTADGHRIYRDFFTGRKGDGGMGAIFSDSSDSEKAAFRQKMTFAHPMDSSQSIFCPWHGKTQAHTLRFHFSFPIRNNEPVYVCYVGQKITRV